MYFTTVLLLFLPCFAGRSLAQEDSIDDAVKQFFDLIETSRKEYPNVSDERVRLILKHEAFPESKEEKCLSGIVLTRSGLISNGKLNIEIWHKLFLLKYNDPKNAEGATENAAYCDKKIKADNDTCRYASKVLKCVYYRNRETGVPPADIPK